MAGRSSIADRAPSRQIQGSEGQNVWMRKYARRIDQLHELYEWRPSEGCPLADVRAGAVMFEEAGPDRNGALDEIEPRVWLAGGPVLAVRREDIPGRSRVAAILRNTSASS